MDSTSEKVFPESKISSTNKESEETTFWSTNIFSIPSESAKSLDGINPPLLMVVILEKFLEDFKILFEII